MPLTEHALLMNNLPESGFLLHIEKRREHCQHRRSDERCYGDDRALQIRHVLRVILEGHDGRNAVDPAVDQIQCCHDHADGSQHREDVLPGGFRLTEHEPEGKRRYSEDRTADDNGILAKSGKVSCIRPLSRIFTVYRRLPQQSRTPRHSCHAARGAKHLPNCAAAIHRRL